LTIALALLTVGFSIAHADATVPAVDVKQRADAVKAEFLHAWRNYEQYRT
jgi:hypothetical protein